jgi:hypothetical protein
MASSRLLALVAVVSASAQQNISQPTPSNQTQVAGTAVSVGNGTAGAGVQRVTVASDNTAFSVNSVQSGTWLFQLPASSAAVITAAATTAVKATAGTLRRISVTTQVASATIKLFDLASASCTATPSTNPRAVLTLPSTVGIPFTVEFQQAFANGICVLTSGATNLTVIYD